MLLRTHIAFAVLAILLFISHVDNKIVFAVMVLVGAIFLDLDTEQSVFGRKIVFRPFQFFTKHRGIVHSVTFGVVVSLILALILPVLALGFFVGFSTHLIADSFTREGVQPFWPHKSRAMGFIYTGGKFEDMIFIVLVAINIVVLLILVF